MAFDIGLIRDVIGLNGMAKYFSSSDVAHLDTHNVCLTSRFHRVWWVAAFILSISYCSSLVYTKWQKYHDSPVIITFDHRPLTIAAVPFPAATICPFIKTKCAIFNYTRVYRLLSRLEGDDERAPNETE